MEEKKEATAMVATKKDNANLVNPGENNKQTDPENIPILERMREDAEKEKSRKEREDNISLLDIWSDDENDKVSFLFRRGDMGVIAENNLHLIKGKKGCCKTFLGMDFILASQGKSTIFALNGNEPLPVLLCDTEQDACTIKERCKTAFRARGITPNNPIYVLSPLRALTVEERRDMVFRAIEVLTPKLVIIDTLPRLMNVGANDKNDTARDFLEPFVRLAENKHCAIIGIMHTNKDKDDDNAAGHLGTVAEQLSAEVYMMERGKGIQNAYRRFSAELKEIPFAFNNDWTITGDLNAVDDARKRELQSIANNCIPESEIRAKDAKERIIKFKGEKNCKERQASNILNEMANMGIIQRREISRNEVYYSLHTGSKQTPPSM